MLVPFKNSKSYGVLHTENYFSFLGFSKKVNSEEVQKIDIFLDDTLIDTIIADKHIEKIEDIYELEGFGFEYILPNKYVGQKSIISFKNHGTKEHLQNSPYELITSIHPKFNEYSFSNSLLNEIDLNKIKNLYCPNTIGFLAVEGNLTDTNFIEYIKEIIKKFPDWKIKALYFNNEQEKLCKKTFLNTQDIEFLPISSIYDLIKNIEIYIHNTSYNNFFFLKPQQILLYSADDIVVMNFDFKIFNLTLEEHSSSLMKKGFPFYDNPYYFGFDDLDIKFSEGNVHKLIASKIPNNKNFDMSLTKTLKQNTFDHLNIALNNMEYKSYMNGLHLKFKELTEQKQ